MMLSGMPNFVFAIGYTSIAWTLKVNLVCAHRSRLLEHRDMQSHTAVFPILDEDAEVERVPLLDLSTGYVQRAIARVPPGRHPRAPGRWRWPTSRTLGGYARAPSRTPPCGSAWRRPRTSSTCGPPDADTTMNEVAFASRGVTCAAWHLRLFRGGPEHRRMKSDGWNRPLPARPASRPSRCRPGSRCEPMGRESECEHLEPVGHEPADAGMRLVLVQERNAGALDIVDDAVGARAVQTRSGY